MNNLDGKIKKWIELIQTEQLEVVVEDIQANGFEQWNDKLNKQIFKLLLYLSHTADKCDKQKCIVGKHIYKLTSVLCSSLIEIPDSNKFVSSLFHIIRCLLTMSMYEEASKVCLYLRPENLCHSHIAVSEILVKIAFLWHNAASNVFLTLQKNAQSSVHYCLLKDIMKYELDMIQVAHKDFTKPLLAKLSSYLDRITQIRRAESTYFCDLSQSVITYLKNVKMSLDEDGKYIIYRHMLHITSRLMCESINENSIQIAVERLTEICSCFKKVLLEDEECCQCFNQFKYMCVTLIKPVESFIDNDGKNIQENTDNYLRIAKSYGYTGAIKWTALSIAQVLEPLLIYWETCIRAGKKSFLSSGVLLDAMNLVLHISIFFIKQVSDKCKSCHSENCRVRRDIYNAVVIKTRCINLISKLSAQDLSKDICALAQKFSEQNIAAIYEMKQRNCKCWTQLWCTCATLIYNLGIAFERYYEESTLLFSLLCTCIIKFEGLQTTYQYISLQNPVCSVLHRLSTVHYNHGMYREAMTATSLHGLLSYKDTDSKAFRMWANIKHKCSSMNKIMELTMLGCLNADIVKIEELGIQIDLSNYDLVQLCLREIKGLHEARVNLSSSIKSVLKEMSLLTVTPIEYARGVQLLGHHLLVYDHDNNFSKLVKESLADIRATKKKSISELCLEANLEFHMFLCQLHSMNKKTQNEMEKTTFALYAPRLSEIRENESLDIVPAYLMINIKEDSKLMGNLQKIVKKWNQCFKHDISEIANSWEPTLTLHMLIVAGEYSHLYRYQECEISIWNLAYELATELKDSCSIIYVTSRNISLRNINQEWIATAKELANKLRSTNDNNYTLAIFWISLSDFYFECDMYKDGRKLLNEVRDLPGISFLENTAVYLYRLDRILCNCYLYKENIEHEEYTRYIVEILYTMINLNEELAIKKYKSQDKYLFGYDILFSATVNLSLRMNSLLSFREISAHLVRRLKSAQALGATIRVAELLKSLCYVDLSRSQLSDCEVKLQGLEHVLSIETFQLSMNTNLRKIPAENFMMTPTRIIDPIRDIPQNDASPVLRNKVFDLPEFIRHSNCSCYACQNVSYHYLVFASTHIRAQLYALQGHYTIALQHFHGAFQIREKLVKTETKSVESLRRVSAEKCSTWQERSYIIDYVLLLLNFSYFLRSDMCTEEQILNIVEIATRTCKIHKLEGHPIHMSVKELMLDIRFQRVFDSVDYATFTVPDIDEIDVSKYTQENKVEQTICTTPTLNNTRPKKPITLRRNRTPPLLKLTKVSMNFSDDEDGNPSPPPTGCKRTRSHKLTRRKILEEDYSDATNTKKQEGQPKSKLLIQDIIDTAKEYSKTTIMRDIVAKIASLAPEISEHVHKAVNDLDAPTTSENVQTLIDAVENLKVNTPTQKNVRTTRNSKQLTSAEYNNKIIQVIDLFKTIDISMECNQANTSNNSDLFEAPAGSISSTEMGARKREKRVSIEETNTEKMDPNILPFSDCNSENAKKTHIDEPTRVRTRSSRRVLVTKEPMETQSLKTAARKSKEKSVQ